MDTYMQRFGKVEVIIGLLLVAFSCYTMLGSVFVPEEDRHGTWLMAGIFGASLGALLAFAGIALHTGGRARALGHLPFLLYCVVVFLTWRSAYA